MSRSHQVIWYKESAPHMTLCITPYTRPYVWSIRSNWNTPNGIYYDPTSGELFSVSDEPYAQYIGRLPEIYLNEPEQLQIVGT